MTLKRSVTFGMLASACLLFPARRALPADCRIDTANRIAIPAHKTPENPDDQPKHAYRLADHSIIFLGALDVDADGAPNAYGPNDSGLDWTANAGHPARAGSSAEWWGVATQDCKSSGTPVLQGAGDPAPGFYVSTTTMTNPAVDDCRKQRGYVDSSSIPYVGLSPLIATIDKDRGRLVAVAGISAGAVQFAIHADEGPGYGIGEGSMELVQRLGLDSNPRDGGTDAREFVYVVMIDREGFPSSAQEVEAKARTAFDRWGGEARLEACRRALLAAPR